MSLRVLKVDGNVNSLKNFRRSLVSNQSVLENQTKAKKLKFIDEYPQCDDRPEIPDYDYDFDRKPTIIDKIGDTILGWLDKIS